MNQLDPRLKRLFAASRPARQARVNADAAAPFGFATRVVNLRRMEPGAVDEERTWARLARRGFGLACGVMLVSLAWNWRPLTTEWSPALTVAQQVTRVVSLP